MMRHQAQAPARRERGFTLIEVLVSIVLLAFVALGAQRMMTGAVRQNKLALDRTTATNLAAARLAQITAMPLQDAANYTNYLLPGETGAAGPPVTLTADFGSLPGFPRFSRVVTLTYNTPVSGVHRVQVDVSWVDRGQNATKSHRVVTLMHPDITTGG